MELQCICFRNLHNAFHHGCTNLYSCQKYVVLFFLHSFTNTSFSLCLGWQSSSWRKVITHCPFDTPSLVIREGEHFVMYLPAIYKWFFKTCLKIVLLIFHQCHLWVFIKGRWNPPKRCLYSRAYYSTIHNSQEMGRTKCPSTDRWIKQCVIYTQWPEKRWNLVMCDNRDGTRYFLLVEYTNYWKTSITWS